MGSPQLELVETDPIVVNVGDRINEWVIDGQVLSPGFMGRNRAWRAHCSICGWERRLHEVTLCDGFIPRCINVGQH